MVRDDDETRLSHEGSNYDARTKRTDDEKGLLDVHHGSGNQ